jgi:glutamate-ammonia-ligase adenylyltransferase
MAPASSSSTDETCHALAPILFASSFLHMQSRFFAADIADIYAGKIDKTLSSAYAEWQQTLIHNQTDSDCERALRHWRNRSHFAIALSELWGHDDITTSYQRLSLVAEQAVRSCVEHLLSAPSTGSGWVILALGKLGAGELNFSSDIDLIILHDAKGSQKPASHFTALTRALSRLLSRQTSDGFGWRVDLRLRPDMGGGAVSLDIDAAVSYYESKARSWERAAFIRAQPVAGDKALGEKFLARIAPFIWRRVRDFTVIDDLQSWLQHLPTPEALLGLDVKKGAYAIRHIELLTHSVQLLEGGRHTDLQVGNTLRALHLCATGGWISPEKAKILRQNYIAWRRIEHRLQYQKDAQTYALPRNEEEFDKFAGFMGYADSAALRSAVTTLQQKTKWAADHPVLNHMLEKKQQQRAQLSPARLPQTQEDLIIWLTELGYARPRDMTDIISKWRAGGISATRGERARSYLEALLAELMPRLSSAEEPDEAFAGFAYLVDGLSAGAQFFALLCQNPQLSDLLCSIMIKAPRLSDILSRMPSLLDRMLDPDFFMPALQPDQLQNSLQESIHGLDDEQALDHLRLWSKEQRFTCEVHFLEGRIRYEQFGLHCSHLADIIIQEICRLASQDFARRYGHIPNSSFAIIGLGRLGSQMMTVHSDLDLMFVYDGDQEAVSDGPRAIGLATYYIKLSQLIVSWLSVATSKGGLYEVDMRLRPDGTAGPIAVHTARLTNYYKNEAWPWEHLALLKARTIIMIGAQDSSPPLTSIADTLGAMRQIFPSEKELRDNIIDMRQRLASSTPSSFDLKKRSGGFLDLEFLTYLAGHCRGLIVKPAAIQPLTPSFLLNCLAENDTSYGVLRDAHARLVSVAHYFRLCLPANHTHNDIPSKQANLIARLAGYPDFTSLKQQVDNDCLLIETRLISDIADINS